MLVEPMEKVILEVLLGLLVHYAPRALKLDSVKGPIQLHCKGGDLLIITLGDIVEVLHENTERSHYAKNNGNFLQDTGNTSGGSHVPGHICHWPL